MPRRIIISLLKQLREKLNGVRERELAAAMKRMPDLTPAQRVTVERLTRAMMTSFMREPSARLRAVRADGHGMALMDAAKYLFALDECLGDRRKHEETARSGEERAA
jgi:glutamyl-tRNA reductase